MNKPIIGKSTAIEKTKKLIKKYSKSQDHILILGEKGTGRSTVAQNIYMHGDPFKNGNSFLTIDTNKISPKALYNLLYTEGESSTIFIDNIDETGIQYQKVLAGYLSDHGNSKYDKNYNRILLTGKDELSVSKDLLAYLDSFKSISLPPLRERTEDIPYLVQHFLTEVSDSLGIDAPVLDINALDLLVKQKWEGNITQLKSVIEMSLLHSNGDKFTLPESVIEKAKPAFAETLQAIFGSRGSDIERSLNHMEKSMIESSLYRFGFNLSESAKFLGIEEETLEEKLKQLGMLNLVARS